MSLKNEAEKALGDCVSLLWSSCTSSDEKRYFTNGMASGSLCYVIFLLKVSFLDLLFQPQRHSESSTDISGSTRYSVLEESTRNNLCKELDHIRVQGEAPVTLTDANSVR